MILKLSVVRTIVLVIDEMLELRHDGFLINHVISLAFKLLREIKD